MMLVVMILLEILLAFIGWGVHKKKWYFLISGYNMMSKEEQQTVQVEKLAKSLAIMSYILAVLLVLLGVFTHYELWSVLTVVTVLIIVVPLVFIVKSNKYYKGGKGSAFRNPKSRKVSITITVISVAFVGVILFFSNRPTTFDVTKESFTINGSYGDTFAYSEIEQLELVETLPEIGVRTNGSALGSVLKGNFKFKNGEQVKLFVDKSVPPFIKMEVDGKLYYFNETDSAKTKALYEQIKENK